MVNFTLMILISGFSQPGTWYEAHIVTPEMEVVWLLLSWNLATRF
jgi:hypothetical protein